MGRYTVELVGESHYQAAVARLSAGDPVRLIHEADNPHDDRAIRVADITGETIGWLPHDGWLTAALLDQRAPVRATIEVVVGGEPDRPMRGVVLRVLTGADLTAKEPAGPTPPPGPDPLYPPETGWREALASLGLGAPGTARPAKPLPNSFQSCMSCVGTGIAVLVLLGMLGQCMENKNKAALYGETGPTFTATPGE